MTTGDRIKQARTAAGITQKELGEKIGVGFSAIHKYETGMVVNLKRDTIAAIAKALGVKPTWLMCMEDEDDEPHMVSAYCAPIIGAIACGEPITAEENFDGEVVIPEGVHADFALRCKGDSMVNARIFDGDIVYIHSQPEVENGQIAAVYVKNDGPIWEATLKRVRKFKDHIILEPENPQYSPMVFWNEEMLKVEIIGVAVAFTSSIR